MFIILSVVLVCEFMDIFGASVGPAQISVTEKGFFRDEGVQSIHLMLMSIENKLQNLENTLSVQCSTILDGRIDYYGRKVDNIEKDLSRFQVFVRMELDKISENISSRNYKDDFIQDRVTRKIDSVYERIRHKLGNIEGQIDIAAIKSQNAREMIMTKLEKVEENLTIRDADMEAELVDAVAAIDDLKATYSSLEENILNGTKESIKMFSKSNEKVAKKQHIQTANVLENISNNLSEKFASLEETVGILLNRTNETVETANYELGENLNEYFNKMTDMNFDLWKKTDRIESMYQNIGKIVNITRSEQQNGLRALMVQIGRQSTKPNDASNPCVDGQKFSELNEKIDLNFEKVIQAQNLFLESCHRVQMDEPQLESQISMILHQLIDIFERKISVESKDIEKLENLIYTHDGAIRENIHHIVDTLLALKQETVEDKEELIDHINNQKPQIEAIYALLQDVMSSNDSKMASIFKTLQSIHLQLNETQADISQVQIIPNKSIIEQLFEATSMSNNAKLQETLDSIHNITHTLTNMEKKINESYLDYVLIKYKIPLLASYFGQQLHQFIGNANLTSTKNISASNKRAVPEVILQLFGKDSSKVLYNSYHHYRYNVQREAKDITLICNNITTSAACNKTISSKNETIPTINGYDIKRTNLINKVELNIPTQNLTKFEYKVNNGSVKSNCTLNYSTMINASSNYDKSTITKSNLPNVDVNEIPANSVSMSTNGHENTKLDDLDFSTDPTEITRNHLDDSPFTDSTVLSTPYTDKTITEAAKESTINESTSEVKQFTTITSTVQRDRNSFPTMETYEDTNTMEEDEQILDDNYALNFDDNSMELSNDFEYTDRPFH